MISPEQRAEIRRLFYAEHWRVGTIATTLGVHHDTVYHAIERDRFVRTGTQVRPSALDPYKAFLAATLEPYPRLLELAGHYHFAPQPCAPYRGNEKGKVERMIQYLRHSFFAARRFASLNALNAQLAAWIAETAHARSVPGTAGRVVREAWAAEQPRLLPLPEHAFVCDLVRPVVSGKTPYIRFDGNDYSIPHTLVRRPLTLVASETAVWLLDSATEVARHPRSYAHGQRVEEPAHLARLAREKRRAHDLRGRDRLRQACPQAERFFDALAQRGAPLASQTAALLRLLDEYGTAALDAALATALARGAINTASVAHLLDQRARARRQPPPLAVVPPADPRARDLPVPPHALTAYDALLTPPTPEPDDADPR